LISKKHGLGAPTITVRWTTFSKVTLMNTPKKGKSLPPYPVIWQYAEWIKGKILRRCSFFGDASGLTEAHYDEVGQDPQEVLLNSHSVNI